MESKLSVSILFLVLVFFAWNVIGFLGKLWNTEENRRVAEEKVEELKERKENMSYEIDRLNTKEGIEENIREKFSVVKEGEKVIIIVDEDRGEGFSSEEEDSGFLNFFKNWFK